MKQNHEQIIKALKNAKTALIVAHIDPDGDCLGSMLALSIILKKLGLKTTCYCQDGVPRIYRFLAGADQVVKELKCLEQFHIGIAVDASDADRLGDKLDLRSCSKIIINIDHHPDNTQFGDINYVSQRSSTAEMIYRLCLSLKVKLDKDIADNLYVALITDTGNFRYESTSQETFAMAAALLRAGVKTHELTTKVYDNKSIASLRINAAALSNLEISPDRKIAWVTVTEEMMKKYSAKSEDLIGLVDRIRSIEGVEVALLFREENGRVKINFRSKERFNVSAIAARFNGGGHHKAAGAVVVGNVEKVKSLVIAQIEDQIKTWKG